MLTANLFFTQTAKTLKSSHNVQTPTKYISHIVQTETNTLWISQFILLLPQCSKLRASVWDSENYKMTILVLCVFFHSCSLENNLA